MVSIGGVGVAVAYGDPVVSGSRDSHYLPFRLASGLAAGVSADIEVEIAAGPPAEPAGSLLFDCDGAWSAYQDGGGYRLVIWSVDSPAEHLVARSDAETTRVTIHIGDSWARFFRETASDDGSPVADPFRYPLDQLLLMNHLATRHGLIVHSGGLELDGAGIVFPGASGAGKTTLSGLLAAAGLGVGLLSDDRVILRADRDGGFNAWGTPWPGDAGVARNASVPLQALYFLVQDESPAIVALAPAAGAQRMFPVISCPWWDRRLVGAVLDTIESLVAAVPCYEFHFTSDQSAVEMLRRHVADPTP